MRMFLRRLVCAQNNFVLESSHVKWQSLFCLQLPEITESSFAICVSYDRRCVKVLPYGEGALRLRGLVNASLHSIAADASMLATQ